MNKKFLSAILFGALTAASTSTFVSCKDYDDDIDQLQMQIDQNASSAASDLAAKVTALESQISTLNAAKQDLTSQLAAAKTEAANAAAAALEAAKGAQSGADAANKALAEAAAKVAVLETKVASLEGIVADLQTAKADLNAKVSDLQTQMAAVKADTKSNADAIAAANAEILAKYSELSGKISEVSTALGARIDVVDATLNTIKANYATKDELNTKAAELAAMDAQLNAQIATNLKYIETLQATVKDLAAKDAELAGKIEANYAELLGKINTMATEQAAALKDIQALQATVATLNSSYSTLSSAKADVTYVNEVKEGLTKLVEQLSTSTNTYSQYIEDLRDRVSKLEQGAADLQKKVDAAATQEALNAAIEDLKSQIKEAGVASDATLAEAIEAVEASVAANAEEIAAIKETLASKADQSALDDLAASLGITQADVMTISLNLKALQAQIADQKAELEGKIAAAEESAKDYAYDLILKLTDLVNANTGNIATNTDAIAALQAAIEDLSDMANGSLSDFVTSAEQADAIDDLYNGISAELDDYVAIVDLKRLYADREELDAKLATLNEELNTWKEGFKTEYEGMKQELKGEIDALKGLNADLVALKDAVDVLAAKVDAIINSVQSIVFVPQYSNNDVLTASYKGYGNQFYDKARKDGGVNQDRNYLTSTIKFRVQPTGVAKKLAEAWTETPNILALEGTDALVETRATTNKYMTIVSVKADGDFLLVDATNARTNASVIPTTLVVTNKFIVSGANEETGAVEESYVLAKTSDYFKVSCVDLTSENYNRAVVGASVGRDVKQVSGTLVTMNNSNSSVGTATIEIRNTYFDLYAFDNLMTELTAQYPYVLPFSVQPESEIVFADDLNNFKNNPYFNVTENGVSVKSLKGGIANPDAIDQTITVRVADKKYGTNSNGVYHVQYDVTYKAIENEYRHTYETFNYSIEWPKVGVTNPQIITVETIAADAEGLTTYKLKAEDVFNKLYDAVGANGTQVSGANNTQVTFYQNVDSKGKRFIEVVPNATLAHSNYWNATPANIRKTFDLDDAYGKLTFVTEIELTRPDPAKFLEKIKYYWDGDNDVALRVNYAYSDLVGEYTYTVELPTAYKNYNEYNGVNGVDYVWTMNKVTQGKNQYVLDGIQIDPITDVLTIDGPIEANGKIYDVNGEEVSFNLNVVSGETTLATVENQRFMVTYPVKEFTGLETVTISADKLKEGDAEAMNVINKVKLVDDDKAVWVKDGEIVKDKDNNGRTTAWKVENLEYSVVKVVCGSEDYTSLGLFEVVNGALVVTDPARITKNITVTIKVSVDYKFAEDLSATYTVNVQPKN